MLNAHLASSRQDIKCSSCHGTPSRPNWEPYFAWPGFYGSDNDHTLRRLAVDKGWISSSQDYRRIRYYKYDEFNNDVEYAKLKQFFDTQDEHPRYNAVIKAFSRSRGFTPNEDLTKLLTVLNARRIVEELFSSGLKAVAIMSFANQHCDNVTWIPERLKAPFEQARAAMPFETEKLILAAEKHEKRQMAEILADYGYKLKTLKPTESLDGGLRPYSVVLPYLAARAVLGEERVRYWPMTVDNTLVMQEGQSGKIFESEYHHSVAARILSTREAQSLGYNSSWAVQAPQELCAKIKSAALND